LVLARLGVARLLLSSDASAERVAERVTRPDIVLDNEGATNSGESESGGDGTSARCDDVAEAWEI
jgi:hypothetical protein